MTDPTDPMHDRIRDTLHQSADQLDVDPLGPATIRRRSTVRRRRRLAVLGGAGVAAIALVGAVVANRDLGGDSLELTSPPETTQPDESTEPAAPTTAPPTTTPITTPPTLPPEGGVTTSGADTPDIAESGVYDFDQIVPWQDGFLRVGYVFEPVPLGPLPDEVVAQFPEEVTALFPDGLPPTMDEAAAVLAEADLLGIVLEIIEANPEVAESIYGAERPPPTAQASFTTDGVEWTPIEFAPPTGEAGQIVVNEDRLITWAVSGDGPEGPPAKRELTIATTTDLVTWQSTTVDLGVTEATDDHVKTDVFANSVAVRGDRWMAWVEQHTWVDFEDLLPEDVRADLQSDSGYGYSTDDDGLTVELYDGDDTTFTTYTWEELGLDGNPEVNQPGESLLLSGSLDGEVEELPVPGDGHFGQVFAGTSGFYLLGEQTLTSTDGVTWVGVPELDDVTAQGYVHSIVPVAGGELFVGDVDNAPGAWLRDADGNVAQVQLPDLPERYGLWNQTGSSAWIVEAGLPDEPDWESVTVVIEHDGFIVELVEGPTASYTLTDAATGETVREATGDPEAGFMEIYEVDKVNQTADMVIRDDNGDEIVRIPTDVAEAAFEAAYADITPPDYEDWQPDLWLIATADGVNWLTVDLDDPNLEPDAANPGYWPQGAAVNGGSVLYPTVDGWILAPLPTGS